MTPGLLPWRTWESLTYTRPSRCCWSALAVICKLQMASVTDFRHRWDMNVPLAVSSFPFTLLNHLSSLAKKRVQETSCASGLERYIPIPVGTQAPVIIQTYFTVPVFTVLITKHVSEQDPVLFWHLRSVSSICLPKQVNGCCSLLCVRYGKRNRDKIALGATG